MSLVKPAIPTETLIELISVIGPFGPQDKVSKGEPYTNHPVTLHSRPAG